MQEVSSNDRFGLLSCKVFQRARPPPPPAHSARPSGTHVAAPRARPPRSGEDSLKRIPICEAHVRSLNLSVAAGIALWEGIRQLDYDSDAPAPAGGGAERQRHIDMYDRRVVAGASGRS